MDLLFTNVSSTACRLNGVPTIQFVDDNGETEASTWLQQQCLPVSSGCESLSAVLEPDQGQTPVPGYGVGPSQASVYVIFASGPPPEGDPSATPCPKSVEALLVTLPNNGGQLTVPMQWSDPCFLPSVGQFNPAPTVSPGPFNPLSAVLHLPDSVMAGTTLQFTVEISNAGPELFSFGPLCPNYEVAIEAPSSVDPKTTAGSHSLNCQLVQKIDAGGSVTFAMQGDIPATVPGGSYSVDWMLNGTTYLVHAGTSSPIDKTPYTINVVMASGAVQPTP
jgi:hypothetical protein